MQQSNVDLPCPTKYITVQSILMFLIKTTACTPPLHLRPSETTRRRMMVAMVAKKKKSQFCPQACTHRHTHTHIPAWCLSTHSSNYWSVRCFGMVLALNKQLMGPHPLPIFTSRLYLLRLPPCSHTHTRSLSKDK